MRGCDPARNALSNEEKSRHFLLVFMRIINMISIFAKYLIIRKSLLIISDEFEILASILPSGYHCYLYHSQFVD